MNIQQAIRPQKKGKTRHNLWFERSMAILALLNLLLVMFDLTYIPLRDFWLQRKIQVFNFNIGPIETQGFPIPLPIPDITKFYDPFKGIVPYRETQQYLEKVDKLQDKLIDPGLQSPEVANILKDLRRRSLEMIDTNPFELANKRGTLEKIKNKMREHLPNPEDSSKEAFKQFWSLENLAADPVENLNFFNEEIRPLIATNYFRPIGENGKFIDLFGLIDFPFFVIFSIEYLARTWFISRRRIGVSWLDAMLWRWYDILLLLPFLRWLRIIPVTIRLDQAKLLNSNRIQKLARQGFVVKIAGDMTEVVAILLINQVQGAIRQGELTKWLMQKEVKPYIDLNDTDEVAALTSIMVNTTVYQVLPKIKPDLEALLQHNLDKVINQSPAYQQLSQLPGLEELQNQLTTRLSQEVLQSLYDGLHLALEEDPVGEKLFQQLLDNLKEALGTEIQTKPTVQEIESLIVDFLEEVKVNYIETLELGYNDEDFEELLDQKRAIRQVAQQ
ncbi:MAG: hypothetical protein F6K47_39830 [Symploca sp. SIO2E6]|nr:hypothetical protein [Symploca sp. SIO2E6]